MNNYNVIIFDGECNFCNSSVIFIINRDHKNVFKFTPLQHASAKTLLDQHGIIKVSLDTFILIKKNECYFRSDAALEITKDLSGYWYLFRILKVIPRSIRDYLYNIIAKYRYRIFGKAESCIIPTVEIRDKFIDDQFR